MISPRLRKIVAAIPDEISVLDIGSDHGQIPIFLALHRKLKRIYATEYRAGPFKNLQESLSRSQVEVECYRADGLAGAPSDIDLVLITGMGGGIIGEILTRGAPYLQANKPRLLLEPQSSFRATRQALFRLGYRMVKEEYLQERTKIYPLIEAEPGFSDCSEVELEFGPLALLNRDPLLKKLLENRCQALANSAAPDSKRIELERLLSLWNHDVSSID